MIRAGAVATLVALALAAGASAARADDDGFIGRPRLRLEIDDCPPHPDLPKPELAARANEYYERAEVLYVQGDYAGAITEFVAAHCLIPAPTVLKDIAQAYERSVRYDLAIAYLERFVVDTDDPTALKNAASRVQVLARLSSTIRVATVPPRAKITVRDGASVRGMAVANTDDVIALPTGRYTMTVELPNYQPVDEELTIGVGQPYSYSYRLEPRRGRLRVQTVPGDARILIDDLFVGAGLFDGEVDLGPHTIDVDQPGWNPAHQTIEVTEQAPADASIALTRPPASARWLAIGGTTAFGTYIGSSVGAIIGGDNAAAGAGLGGLVAGAVGGYVLVPEDIHQGTASLLLTATTAGIIGGLELGTALSDDNRLVTSTTLAGSVVGATAAVLVVRQTAVSDGQAALVNSGLLWGTISGLLFTQVFIGSERTDVALTAAGSNLGLLTGIVLARRYDVSRRRSIYIDLAGAAGLVAGLAVQNGVQSSGTGSNSDESRSHFTLAGMAVGLGLGIYLTRNFDAPRLRIQPQLVPVRDAAGGRGAVLGFVGTL
ncbi:MAG: PEGA domain-containing protein [Myxococcales bacterium]|nr:PEGA domain-containing protein [Myxococcales bacterium]